MEPASPGFDDLGGTNADGSEGAGTSTNYQSRPTEFVERDEDAERALDWQCVRDSEIDTLSVDVPSRRKVGEHAILR